MTPKKANDTQGGFERMMPIRNERGLHARAAARFVQAAGTFDAEIAVSKGGQTVSGRSIMGLMMLAAGIGSEIAVTAQGVDAEAALESLAALVDGKFGEEV